MRKSEILERLWPNAPCLFCDHAVVELPKLGHGDFAFLIPSVGYAVWASPGLSEDERVQLNNALSKLVRSLEETSNDRSRLADSTRQQLLPFLAKCPPLAAILDDFLAAFTEPCTPAPPLKCPKAPEGSA